MKAKVEWDLEGITYDEPKATKKRVRPAGRFPLSDFNSDEDVDSNDVFCALARGAWSSPPSPTAQVQRPLSALKKESDWTVVGKGKGNPLPNEYTTQAAVPAPDVPDASLEGPEVEADIAPVAGEPEEDPEDPSGEGGIPPADAEIVRGPRPKGTVEEAQSREHMMTHLPKNSSVRSAQKPRSNAHRSGKRRTRLSQTARRANLPLNLENRSPETTSSKTRVLS